MSQPGFWDDAERARERVQELKQLKATVEPLAELRRRSANLEELLALTQSEGDHALLPELRREVAELGRELDALALATVLSGPDDHRGAYFQIQAGAGGTESCDWAQMLLRMYTRYFERRGYKVRMQELTPNEEAGLRSVTLSVAGDYVFGRLKGETGVHRLVRISPFDASARRHTSFAAVDVTPLFEEDVEVDLREEDLHIDTYRSSGPGGQHVNKTDSAVRISHLPTGIVVQCQSDRSQHRNRATALAMLKAKLYQLKKAEREAAATRAYEAKGKIAWGNQIRSYVLQPYTLAKDHRTGLEVGNVQGVLDGELEPFIEAYLKAQLRAGGAGGPNAKPESSGPQAHERS
jgi:peptide chain release factor 2